MGLLPRIPEIIALSPGYANDQTLFVGTDDDGVFKSINGGVLGVTLDCGKMCLL